VEATDGGTLFLDEISETTLSFQVKLLRVTRNSRCEGWDRTSTRRLTCASWPHPNRDVGSCSRKASFARTSTIVVPVVRIDLPSLEERRDDIPLLVAAFSAALQRENALSVTIDPRSGAASAAAQMAGQRTRTREHRNRLAILRPPERSRSPMSKPIATIPWPRTPPGRHRPRPTDCWNSNRQHILQILPANWGQPVRGSAPAGD